MDGTSTNTENSFSLDSIANLEIFKQNPKLFLRLKLCVEQNNYYEAHQAYKTLHFRCNNNNLVEDSLELIYNGICFFLENKQVHCGFDLSKTFVETLKKLPKITLNESLINRISHIHKLLKNSSEERNEFTVTILKWSSVFNQSNETQNKTQFGHPDIHRQFAITLCKENDYPQSRYHFLRSNDGESCAHMLVEFHLKSGFSSEIDLFITQTVLQYLCLRNKQAANTVFTSYIKLHPKIDKNGPPYSLPLLNFLSLLLNAVDLGKLPLFTVLCDKYAQSLARDPNYKQYLDKIGHIYFNLQAKNSDQDNPLNNILRMFIGGGGGSESDTNAASNMFFNAKDMGSLMDLDDNEDLD